MRKSLALRETRAKAVADARVIFKKAEDDNDRPLNSDEEEAYDKIDAEIRSLDTQIERHETQENREKGLTPIPAATPAITKAPAGSPAGIPGVSAPPSSWRARGSRRCGRRPRA